MSYADFLKRKETKQSDSGFTIDRDHLHKSLFEYQKDIVKWALKRGKALSKR